MALTRIWLSHPGLAPEGDVVRRPPADSRCRNSSGRESARIDETQKWLDRQGGPVYAMGAPAGAAAPHLFDGPLRRLGVMVTFAALAFHAFVLAPGWHDIVFWSVTATMGLLLIFGDDLMLPRRLMLPSPRLLCFGILTCAAVGRTHDLWAKPYPACPAPPTPQTHTHALPCNR